MIFVIRAGVVPFLTAAEEDCTIRDGMSSQAILTLVILGATLLVLASQRIRPDLVAVCATLALMLTNVLTPDEAFAALGQSVIVVLICIYVLGAALYDTGVAAMIADRLLRVNDRGLRPLLLVLMLTAGLLSAVLSSLLVVVVMMPALLRTARKSRMAPSQLLLPLVVSAAAGNLLTLIGTVSNLVVSDLLTLSGFAPLSFFSLTPYGLVSLALVTGWFLIVGHKLLRREASSEPERPSLDEVEHAYRLDQRLYRLRVRAASDLVGQRLEEVPLASSFRLNVLAIQPPEGQARPAGSEAVLEQNDVLIVEGARGNIHTAAARHTLEPMGTMGLEEFNRLEQEQLSLAEMMVPFRSRLVGQTLAQSHFRERFGLNVLAVHRRSHAIRKKLSEMKVAAGDTLLVQGPEGNLLRASRDHNLVLATQLGPEPGELITAKAKLTIGILLAMIVAVVSGLLPLAPAMLATVVALILTGCISLERAYQSVEGNVVVLIAGMLPLAVALDRTGAAEALAGQLAALSPTVGPLGTLLLLYLSAFVITQVVSNSATAALMTPIAIRLATAQGLDPQPFAMAMAIAVTTSYATPLSNADNLLVRQPGQYRLRDYLVNGLPLFALQTAAMAILFWLV
jgi:di/tricarboxylate transporter